MFGVDGTGDTSGYGGLERQQVSAGSSQRPYGSYFDDIADQLERAYPEFRDAIYYFRYRNSLFISMGSCV